MSSKKKLFKNFSSLTLLQISNYLFPIITLPYLLRILGPENYGLMAFAAAFAAYFGILVDYGFNLSIPPKISVQKNDKEKIAEIFSSVMMIKGALLAAGFLILLIVLSLIPKFNAEREIFLLSFLAVAGQFLFPVWLFQGLEKMHFTAFISVVIKALSVIFIFILIKSPGDLHLLIFINSFSVVMIGAVSLLIIFFKLSIKFKWQELSIIKYYAKEGFHLFMSSVSISLYTTTNVFLLGLLAGNTFVGYYTAADKIRLAVQNLFLPVSQTIYPHLAGLFKDSVPSAINFIKKILKSAGVFIFTVCLLIFIFAGQIILLVAGSGYEASEAVLRIIAFLPFIIFLSNMAGVQTMLNLGYKKSFNKIIMTAAAISLMLSVILVPVYQEIGTSITFLVTEIFVTTSMIIFIKHNLKLRMEIEQPV